MPLKFEQINDASFQDTILSGKKRRRCREWWLCEDEWLRIWRWDASRLTTLNSGIGTKTVDSSPDN